MAFKKKFFTVGIKMEGAMSSLQKSLLERRLPDGDDWFLAEFMNGPNSFIDHEGEYWDFKGDWPFSYSDKYFIHLVKLVIAFANTQGGIIIFGVDDKNRTAHESAVRPNVDKFTSSVVQILDNPPEICFKNIKTPEGISIYIVGVFPNQKCFEPTSFKSNYAEKHGVERFWVRIAHETIPARSKHSPILFCGAGRLNNFSTSKIEVSLPPNPATIRQFIGRLEPFAKVFEWLGKPNEPRVFLYGRGGSGKTTIAYEIAQCLGEYGSNIDLGNNERIDNVIFLSAKQSELDTLSSKTRQFAGMDFTDSKNLITSILVLSAWSDFDKLEEMNIDSLYIELQNLFDNFSCFIVIDDIDTLTTKGIDAGFDQIFRAAIRAKRITKILYTQRNAPTQSLSNSIEVPGLSALREYPRFVEVCASQFKVDEPLAEIRDGKLATVTERRPLIIETIIALRRSSGSYDRAITLFEENVGTDAKNYVFEREWNALPSDYSRHLLCALALIAKPLLFEDIKIILRYEDGRIVEALNESREMFLETSQIEDNTVYSLGELTRSFVIQRARQLDKYASIEARVNSFKRSFFPELPELSRLMASCDNLLRLSNKLGDVEMINQAWARLWDQELPAKVTEDPRFRAYRGYVGTKLVPPDMQSIREDFEFAFSMRFDPPEEHVRAWYITEEQCGEAAHSCVRICDYVQRGRAYSTATKIGFLARKAGFYYNRGKEYRVLNVEESKRNLQESLIIHSQVYYSAIESGDFDIFKYETYYRNTALLLFSICASYGDVDGMIDAIIECAKRDRAFLDPFSQAIREYLVPAVSRSFNASGAERRKGRLQHLSRLIDKSALWEEDRQRAEVADALGRLVK